MGTRGGHATRRSTVLDEWLISPFDTVLFVVISTLLIYVSTLAGLRLGDRRALTQLSPFDFVVAVALGSIVARTATTRTPTFLEGLAAIVTLLVTHRVFSLLRRHSRVIERLVDQPPVVLIRDGRVQEGALRRADFTEGDLTTMLREQGVRSIDDVALSVLETRGVVSVVMRGDRPIDDRLDDVGM